MNKKQIKEVIEILYKDNYCLNQLLSIEEFINFVTELKCRKNRDLFYFELTSELTLYVQENENLIEFYDLADENDVVNDDAVDDFVFQTIDDGVMLAMSLIVMLSEKMITIRNAKLIAQLFKDGVLKLNFDAYYDIDFLVNQIIEKTIELLD